jgi:hypothetical protein
MDSHIQMPRVVLKEFVNDRHSYYKYCVLNNEITIGVPKKTYTEQDYYSEEMEQYLNQNIETPLKTLIEFAKSISDKEDIISADSSVIDTGWAYLKSLLARSKTCHNIFQQRLIYGQFFLSSQSQHDLAVHNTFKLAGTLLNEKEFDFSFLTNLTSMPLVLPTRGIYEFTYNQVLCLIAPLSPRCAIFLKRHGKMLHPDMYENSFIEIPIGCEERITYLNSIALRQQISEKTGYIVCPKRSVLNDLLSYAGITPRWKNREHIR